MNEEQTQHHNEIMQAIDQLAQMTKNGFDKTVSTEDFHAFKFAFDDLKKGTDKALLTVQSTVSGIGDRLQRIEDIVEPLHQDNGSIKQELRDIESRLAKLETSLR